MFLSRQLKRLFSPVVVVVGVTVVLVGFSDAVVVLARAFFVVVGANVVVDGFSLVAVVLMTACVAGSAVVIAAGVVAGTATTGTVKTSAIINYIQLYIVISTGLYLPVS